MDKQIVTGNATTDTGYRLPENTTLQHAIKLAIVEDKPIMMDYWTNSLDKTVLIGVKDDETKEKILVRSEMRIPKSANKRYWAETIKGFSPPLAASRLFLSGWCASSDLSRYSFNV
jgi:hypothetical protein